VTYASKYSMTILASVYPVRMKTDIYIFHMGATNVLDLQFSSGDHPASIQWVSGFLFSGTKQPS
jgi:hypothetical protein